MAIIEVDHNAGVGFFLLMIQITKLAVVLIGVHGLIEILGDLGESFGRVRRRRRDAAEDGG